MYVLNEVVPTTQFHIQFGGPEKGHLLLKFLRLVG
jgi:hypothetical protein